MQELPLAVQLRLQTLPGREQGIQEVDLILDDGRLIEGVTVQDCMYVEDDRFESELVNDVLVPGPAASPLKMALFWAAVVAGVAFMLWAIGQIQPN